MSWVAYLRKSQYLLHQVWVSDYSRSRSRQWQSVSIPSSSGMGVGRLAPSKIAPIWRLNTFFIRYGCRTDNFFASNSSRKSQYLLHQVWVSDNPLPTKAEPNPGLNTFFIRYGCRTLRTLWAHRAVTSQYLLQQVWVTDIDTSNWSAEFMSQYLLHQVWVSDANRQGSRTTQRVSIPSSSGMGVGHWPKIGTKQPRASQYLLHQVWVSDLYMIL